MMELAPAQNKILRLVSHGIIEDAFLGDAVGRVAATPLRCRRPLPHFDYSLMDGFAINGSAHRRPPATLSFKVIGELAAGCTEIPRLAAGEAVRIMTGAAVPAEAERVVPCEVCHEKDGRVYMPLPLPAKTFICRLGATMKSGAVIIQAREQVALCHLEALAASGYEVLPVFARPAVSFFCTGSELVDIGMTPAIGQKISSNPYLLHVLIRQAGGIAVNLGIVPDNPSALAAILARCQQEAAAGTKSRFVVSTGGMGPGQYDLTAAAFRKMGGKVVYDSLAIKSGSTLCGRLGNILYFALPGPPPAVSRLFPLLIAPAIRRFQGLGVWRT